MRANGISEFDTRESDLLFRHCGLTLGCGRSGKHLRNKIHGEWKNFPDESSAENLSPGKIKNLSDLENVGERNGFCSRFEMRHAKFFVGGNDDNRSGMRDEN
jgi:hypothetical protein